MGGDCPEVTAAGYVADVVTLQCDVNGSGAAMADLVLNITQGATHSLIVTKHH